MKTILSISPTTKTRYEIPDELYPFFARYLMTISGQVPSVAGAHKALPEVHQKRVKVTVLDPDWEDLGETPGFVWREDEPK